jgi:hypothetical protein
MRWTGYFGAITLTVFWGYTHVAQAAPLDCVDTPIRTFTASGGATCTFYDMRFTIGTDTGELWNLLPAERQVEPRMTFSRIGNVYTISWINLSGADYSGPEDVGFIFNVITLSPYRVVAMAPLAWTQLGGPVTPEEAWSQTLAPPPYTSASVTIAYFEPSTLARLASLSQSFTIGTTDTNGTAVPEPGSLYLLLGVCGAAGFVRRYGGSRLRRV